MEDRSLTTLIQEYLGRKDAEKLFDAGYTTKEVEEIVLSEEFNSNSKDKIIKQCIS